MTAADAVAADYAERLRTFGVRAPGRFAVEVAGLTIVSLGVEEPWGTQIVAMPDPPQRAAVDEAVAWCRERGREPEVVVRGRHRDLLADFSLMEDLAALVASTAGATQDALEIRPPLDVAEFCAIYSASFEMRPGLAEALVVEADLAAPDVRHLVGSVQGRAVACAQLRLGDELAFVNGVGVVPDMQRRGYGAAMLAACRVEAAQRGRATLWLNASAADVPFYEGIGFEVVDSHVALSPSG